MEQNIAVPPRTTVFAITSLRVVVYNFGGYPIGMQFVYADLFENSLRLRGRIQERLGIPIANQLWMTGNGVEMNDYLLVERYVKLPHSSIHLFTTEDWPPPDYPHHILLPPPPPPGPQKRRRQQQQAESFGHESAGSNNYGDDVVGGGDMHGGPVEIVNGGANLQVCEGFDSMIHKLVYVSRSDILCDMFVDTNISSFLVSVFEKDSIHTLAKHIKKTYFAVESQTEKLKQQMVIPLSVSAGTMLPSWCSKLMAECPFLFSFEARNKYFLLTALGSPLVQSHSSTTSNCNSSPSGARGSLEGNFPLKKFRVHRTLILNSAARMMDAYAHQKVTLEVEHTEELGTGLGQTPEFYILVCHGYQKLGLDMWREDHSFPSSGENVEPGFVVASFGPFPCPWSATMDSSEGVNFSEVLKRFVLLENVVAKALEDGRVLDLALSKDFYKLALDQVNKNMEKYVSLIADATLNSGILWQVEAFESGFNQEFDYLVGAVPSPGSLFVATGYGSKLSSEIRVTGSLLEKVDVLIIGGRMVFTFHRSKNYSVGTSLLEEDKVGLAKSLCLKARPRRVQLVLPLDIIVADKFAPDADSKRVGMCAVLEGWMGLYSVPVSININNGHLDKAKIVVWYGIMGVFGMEKFAHGAQLATGAGPLCDEPMWGLAFIVQANVTPVQNYCSESDVSTQLADRCGIFTGQIMTVVKEACRTALLQKQPQLLEAMYFCELNTPAEEIGSMYGILSKRPARVLKEDMQEGSSLFIGHVYVSFEKRYPELQVLYA